MGRIPYFKRVPGGRGVIVLAVDGHVLDQIDEIVDEHSPKGQSVVVLVGNRFHAEPLRPGAAPRVEPGHITAPPAWDWIREHLPHARDCIFVP